MKNLFAAFLWISFLFLIGCNNGAEKKRSQDYFSENQLRTDSSLANVSDEILDSTFNEFRKKLKDVEIDGQLYYVVESDLLIDEDDLDFYFKQRFRFRADDSAVHLLKREINAFTVSTINGQREVWNPGSELSYCILRRTFSSQEAYDSAIAFMKTATTDWMQACGIKFSYQSQFDNEPVTQTPPGQLTFFVREFNAGGSFVAQAFFPSDKGSKRRILIDPSLFALSGISKVGVLRHELGHVLGARHEHIWSGSPDCAGEQIFFKRRGATALTTYDPYSVMHYLCGNGGSVKLELTKFDIEGAQKLYGTP